MDTGKFIVPYERNRHFVGRTELLGKIQAQLSRTKIAVLEGLNGIGKTQIAVEYAYQFREINPNTSIFWVQASDIETLERDCHTIATCLDPGASEHQQHDTMHLVKSFLERARYPWLLIIDQADDVCYAKVLRSFAPRVGFSMDCGFGQLLYTTSDRKVTEPHRPINVGPMSETESSLLLANMLDNRVLPSLSERLERIPLALIQATHFIQRHESADLDGHQLSQLLREPVWSGSSKLPFISTTAVWISTFERITHSNPRATDIMSIVIIFGGTHVPSLLVRSVGGFTSNNTFGKAYGTLMRHHFMVEKLQSDYLTMRPVLKLVGQNWLIETARARKTLNHILALASASTVKDHLDMLDLAILERVLQQYGREELLGLLSRRELPRLFRRQIAGCLKHPPKNVILRTGDQEVQVHEVEVHEDVLCYWSSYFQALLRGVFKEAQKVELNRSIMTERGLEAHIKEVDLDCEIITKRGLDELVHFVYHGDCESNTEDVLVMVEYFGLPWKPAAPQASEHII